MYVGHQEGGEGGREREREGGREGGRERVLGWKGMEKRRVANPHTFDTGVYIYLCVHVYLPPIVRKQAWERQQNRSKCQAPQRRQHSETQPDTANKNTNCQNKNVECKNKGWN